MNSIILKDILHLKKEIMEEISEHLPESAKEKMNRLEYEFMAALNEISGEYLKETKKPEEEKTQMKKVSIE